MGTPARPRTSTGMTMLRVFMSYRRTDDANFTGRFHDKLIGIFGDANVFRDIDSIPAGTRFEDVITARLADVDAVVALIGPTWAARIGSPSTSCGWRSPTRCSRNAGDPGAHRGHTASDRPTRCPTTCNRCSTARPCASAATPTSTATRPASIDGVREAVNVATRARRRAAAGSGGAKPSASAAKKRSRLS